MNSDTPRTDEKLDGFAEDQRAAIHYNGKTFIEFARSLERELSEANKQIALAKEMADISDGHLKHEPDNLPPVQRIRIQFAGLLRCYLELREERDEWRKMAEELEEYAMHGPNCAGEGGEPCDCGLKESLARFNALKAKYT